MEKYNSSKAMNNGIKDSKFNKLFELHEAAYEKQRSQIEGIVAWEVESERNQTSPLPAFLGMAAIIVFLAIVIISHL